MEYKTKKYKFEEGPSKAKNRKKWRRLMKKMFRRELAKMD